MTIDSATIDWGLLAAQKHQLVKLTMAPEGHDPKLVAAAAGLVEFLDNCQDTAEAQGDAVIFLKPETEEFLEARMMNVLTA